MRSPCLRLLELVADGDLFAPVLPVTHSVMQRMPELARRHPSLAARELVHVATCREHAVEAIVSPDRGFDAVAEITRIDPLDDAAIAAYGRG